MDKKYSLTTITSPYGSVTFDEKGKKVNGMGLLGKEYNENNVYLTEGFDKTISSWRCEMKELTKEEKLQQEKEFTKRAEEFRRMINNSGRRS